MFQIKEKAQRPAKQDPSVPIGVTRGLLFSLRYAHAWQKLVLDAYRAMPSEWRPLYKRWADIEIRPTFDELMQLIEAALRQGILTVDEAVALRAAKPIDLHFPSEESQPVLSTESKQSDPACCTSGDDADA